MALLPGFVDAHVHLLALASRLRELDCGPDNARSTDELVALIARRAAKTPPGRWVRAYGYDEHLLRERRHPTRHDLDRATARHPVRLDHGSGHACVLNSTALDALGITSETPGPAWGVIERDASGQPPARTGGQPTGLLLEMNDWVSSAMRLVGAQPAAPLREASRLLLSHGVTTIMDATPANGVERWRTFQRLKRDGALCQRVGMMVGVEHLEEAVRCGLAFGAGDEGLWVGPAKVMLTLTAGVLSYGEQELAGAIARCDAMGFPVAVHAIEREAVVLAASAFLSAKPRLPGRIEHCAECPPSLVRRLVRANVQVVTNPGFIYHRGERYLASVPPDVLPHLYPARALLDAGVPLAAGSDAPVAPADPLLGMCAAITRKTKAGVVLAPQEAVTAQQALDMHTLGAARACYRERDLGSITPGKLADLVLLSDDLLAVEPEALKEIRVMMTVVGGGVVWEG
jgi:predicted amidohydrolase YtcJ